MQINSIEDEIHFMCVCNRYDEERKKLFTDIAVESGGKWRMERYNDNEKFDFLMGGSAINMN